MHTSAGSTVSQSVRRKDRHTLACTNTHSLVSVPVKTGLSGCVSSFPVSSSRVGSGTAASANGFNRRHQSRTASASRCVTASPHPVPISQHALLPGTGTEAQAISVPSSRGLRPTAAQSHVLDPALPRNNQRATIPPCSLCCRMYDWSCELNNVDSSFGIFGPKNIRKPTPMHFHYTVL